MKLYIAGPYYSKSEKKFNADLAKKLAVLGYEVFLPQRDGVKGGVPCLEDVDDKARRIEMFELNSSKVMEADVFVYVLDGRVPDEGAAVELGMAFVAKQSEKKSKLLVGYRTDNRVAFLGSKLNPMLLGALDFITGHEKELIDYLKSYNFSLSKNLKNK